MDNIICPTCNTATSLNPIVIKDESAFLPDSSHPNKPVYGKANVFAITDNEHPFYVSYAVYRCQACGERFAAKRHKYDDNRWVAIHPLPHSVVSDDIPQPVKSNYEEATLCMTIEAYKACVAMCQITLESLWRDKSVSGLKELYENGIIATQIYGRADEIRLWGNVVKHELIFDEILKDDADQLITYLDKILNEVYVEPIRFNALKEKRRGIEAD